MVHVVVNLGSGGRDQKVIAGEIASAFAAHGVEAPIALVTGREVAGAARRAIKAGATVIVAGGGDGTISTVASLLAGTGATLGVLPLGTLNHFAKDLRIPLDIPAAVETIVAGHSIAVDVGEVNGLPFINNSSIGLYPRMVWEREQQRRDGRRKWLALVVAVGRIWQQYRRVRVALQHDNQHRVVHTPFVFVGNNQYEIEGLKLGGRQRLDAGVLHVTMAPGMTRAELVRGMGAALVGRLHTAEHFESLSVKALTIEARRARLGVTLDGELTALETPLLFRTHPGALRVLVPAP